MTRREFSITLAGAVAFPASASPVVILRAIAAARLPETLTIANNFPEQMREGVWELRTYKGVAPVLASHFASVSLRAGIRPLLSKADGSDLTYLIPFENLTARDRAWTALNVDPEWTRLRRQFASYRFGLYQREPDRARSGS